MKSEIDLNNIVGTWRPISEAPKDGTPFVWMHYITVLHSDRPYEYKPHVDILRRAWINEEKAGRQGDGYWMGQYGSKSDSDASYGWCIAMPTPNLSRNGYLPNMPQ